MPAKIRIPARVRAGAVVEGQEQLQGPRAVPHGRKAHDSEHFEVHEVRAAG
jgi:hypothetical protein